MPFPKVSVIFPIYNAEKYLREAISSLLEQTFKDFEIIAIDDGSTDGSADIISGIKDDRIRLLRTGVNYGVAKAINIGIEASTGMYIARMDADDLSHPERFATQCAFLDSHPDISVVGTDILRVDARGKLLEEQYRNPTTWGRIKWHLFLNCCVAHPSIMMRRQFLEKMDGYRSQKEYAQDYDLWLRAIGNGLRIVNLPDPLISYRIYSGNISSVKKSQRSEIAARILKEHLNSQLGIDLDLELVQRNLQIPDNRIPITSLARLLPFYAHLARQSFRDPETTFADFIFILRRLTSRMFRGLAGPYAGDLNHEPAPKNAEEK